MKLREFRCNTEKLRDLFKKKKLRDRLLIYWSTFTYLLEYVAIASRKFCQTQTALPILKFLSLSRGQYRGSILYRDKWKNYPENLHIWGRQKLCSDQFTRGQQASA
jgi:hypothetical protein